MTLVHALSLTQIPGHTRNKRVLRNFSGTTQMFTRESPHHFGVRDYFSRRKSSAPQMRATALNPHCPLVAIWLRGLYMHHTAQ